MTEVRLSSAAGRWVVAATVLGSGMAMLDATVVNIALPAIEDELDAGLGGLQWTLDGYLLTLASLIRRDVRHRHLDHRRPRRALRPNGLGHPGPRGTRPHPAPHEPGHEYCCGAEAPPLRAPR